MLNVQVLVSTMNNDDCEQLVSNMNINSDAIVINQDNSIGYKGFDFKNHLVKVYSVDDKGLSKSRNTALLKCTGDLLCIADDDMVYSDTYVSDIINEFERNPNADAILFYVKSINGREGSKNIKRSGRLGRVEYKEFCSVEIVIKRDKLMASNIWFNTLFGSGSIYKCGEDSIFLNELLRNGFVIYKSDVQIATVDMSESSWFNGYNEEFFFNKGALVYHIYGKMWPLVVIALSLKNSISKLDGLHDFFKLFRWYSSGVNNHKLRKIHN